MVLLHQQIIIIEVVMIDQIGEKNHVGKSQAVVVVVDMLIQHMTQTKVVSFKINLINIVLS